MELQITNLNKFFKVSRKKSEKSSSIINKKDNVLHVLKDLNLSILDNEMYCLLGNNGAGKSTLMNCIGGIHIPNSGRILLKSSNLEIDVVKEAKKAKRKIIFNFQDPKFDTRLSVKSNLDFHLRMFMINRETRKKLIEEYLKLFNLYTKKDSKVYFLSGGQKKQLENIRGFITSKALKNEDILFLTDEPTAYCDVVAKNIIWEEIESIRSRGTVLFSTNDLNEAEKLIKKGKIGFIKDGVISFSGSLSQLEKLLTKKGNLSLITESNLEASAFRSFTDLLKEQFDSLAINSIPEMNAINIENINQEEMNEVISEAIVYFQSQNIFLNKIEKIKPTLNDLFIYNGVKQ